MADQHAKGRDFLYIFVVLRFIVVKIFKMYASAQRRVARIVWNSRLLVYVLRRSVSTSSATHFVKPLYDVAPPAQKHDVFKSEYLNSVFWNLASHGPAFCVDPSKIEFLKEPEDFYNQLLAGIKKAKQRVVLASLYLGIGDHEDALVDAITAACERNKDFRVTILLDGFRGNRWSHVPGNTADAKKQKISSVTMLQPLVAKFPDKVTIALYHTPDLRGFWKKVVPNRYNETIGVAHVKVYIVDDDVMMSGANLSKDYFTKRQDRYSWVRGNPAIANYYQSVVDRIGAFSYHLNTNGSIALASGCIDFEKDAKKFKEGARDKIKPLLRPYTFYSTGPESTDTPVPHMSSGKHTWLFPTIQMGPFDIRQDEAVTCSLFQCANPRSILYLTSPYFNLTDKYTDLLIKGKSTVDIITASPQANGFYNAKGLAGVITSAYTYIEKQFYDKIENAGQSNRIKIYEYIRNGWTFHGKGLWATEINETIPSICLIGSPNFGGRSVDKDLEAQAVMITEDDELKAKFEAERKYLWDGCQPVDAALFERRKVSRPVQALTKLIGGFL